MEKVNTLSSSAEEIKIIALNEIVDAAMVNVPCDMEGEIESRMRVLSQQRKYRALQTRDFSYMLEDPTMNLNNLREEAERSVKTELFLTTVVAAERIVVTREELEKEASAIAMREKISVKMVKDFLGENMEALKTDLLMRKAADIVYSLHHLQHLPDGILRKGERRPGGCALPAAVQPCGRHDGGGCGEVLCSGHLSPEHQRGHHQDP